MFLAASAESSSFSAEAHVFFYEEWSANKGKAGTKFDYAHRLNDYRPVAGVDAKYGDLVASGHGNLPAWARHRPRILWEACDLSERKTGPATKGFITALPREGTLQQLIDLCGSICKFRFGTTFAYSWALHMVEAADGGMNPHLHVMYSPRMIDLNVPLGMSQHFKRFDAAVPGRGGYRKEAWLPTKWQRSNALQHRRAAIAEAINDFLMRLEVKRRVASVSYHSLGIDLRGEPKRRRGGMAGRSVEITRERAARTALVAALESLAYARWSFLRAWQSSANDRLLQRQAVVAAAVMPLEQSLSARDIHTGFAGSDLLQTGPNDFELERASNGKTMEYTPGDSLENGGINVQVSRPNLAPASPESERSRRIREELTKQFGPQPLRELSDEDTGQDHEDMNLKRDEL